MAYAIIGAALATRGTLYLLYLTKTIEVHPKITKNIVASINWHLAWNL